jgi:hypothetical protein
MTEKYRKQPCFAKLKFLPQLIVEHLLDDLKDKKAFKASNKALFL